MEARPVFLRTKPSTPGGMRSTSDAPFSATGAATLGWSQRARPLRPGGRAALQGIAVARRRLTAFIDRPRRGQAGGQVGSQMGGQRHPHPRLTGLEGFLTGPDQRAAFGPLIAPGIGTGGVGNGRKFNRGRFSGLDGRRSFPHHLTGCGGEGGSLLQDDGEDDGDHGGTPRTTGEP